MQVQNCITLGQSKIACFGLKSSCLCSVVQNLQKTYAVLVVVFAAFGTWYRWSNFQYASLADLSMSCRSRSSKYAFQVNESL